MPLVFLEQLPLPSLQSYVAVSLLLFVSSFLYAFNNITTTSRPLQDTLYNFMTSDNFCFWSNLNMVYGCLFMFGKVIQRIVFGDLRAAELQQIQDKFWNFVFYKFIFIFGVLNVQKMNEVMWWTAWFTLLGFFHLFAQLCKDRFEYLSFSPTTTPSTHGKIAGLLVVLLFLCNGLFSLTMFVGWPHGIHTFTFMLAECIMLLIKIVHVLILYGIHLWDIGHVGTWEGRNTWSYYTDLLLDIGMCSVDFAHHLHMLLWSNIFLSMASLVLCMQLRHLFYEIKKRLARHRNFVRIQKCTETRFPEATTEELLQNNDDCAICWDNMGKARKLPCNHLFHSSCLRAWLENDTSCPTCRKSLAEDLQPEEEEERSRGMAAFMTGRDIRRNHFHFDGTRIASWFPSFSVEVVHTHTDNMENLQLPESRVEAMAHQVHAMFPHVPINIITEDLRQTHSIELTTDNFLEGRVAVPSIWAPPEQRLQNDDELLPIEESSIPTEDSEESDDDTNRRHEPSIRPNIDELRRWRQSMEESAVDYTDTTRAMQSTSGAEEGMRRSISESRRNGMVALQSEAEPSRETRKEEATSFHPNPNDRESLLQKRKEEMKSRARRRLLARDSSSSTSLT